MKKRNWLFVFSAILSIYVLIAFSGCATAEEDDGNGNQTCELNVTLGEGVTGTPTTGTYPYEEGDTVDYSYSLLPNYDTLTVTFDGEAVDPAGTITITGTHNLKANALPVYDLNGNWSLQEAYDDGSAFSVTLTFTGTSDSGTVTDSDGGSGTYTVNTANVITFNLVFPEVTYQYTGIFIDVNNMNGDSERVIGNKTYFGEWSAARDDQAAWKITPTGKKNRPD